MSTTHSRLGRFRRTRGLWLRPRGEGQPADALTSQEDDDDGHESEEIAALSEIPQIIKDAAIGKVLEVESGDDEDEGSDGD